MPSYEAPTAVILETGDGARHRLSPQGFTETGVWLEWSAETLLPFRETVRLTFLTATEPHLSVDVEVVLALGQSVGVECNDPDFRGVFAQWALGEPAVVTSDLASRELPVVTATQDLRIVLIVEDDPAIAFMLQTTLSKHGFDCVSARTVKAARELFDRRVVGAVLLDWMLPKESGHAFLTHVKQERPNVPVAVVSGVVTLPATRAEVQRLGADRTFSKPFKMSEVLGWVREAMR